MELSGSAELSEVCGKEEAVRAVEGRAQRNEVDFGRNFDLKKKQKNIGNVSVRKFSNFINRRIIEFTLSKRHF